MTACYCGHDCTRCYVYLATAESSSGLNNVSSALRRRAAEFYHVQFGIDVPDERLHCHGGRSDDVFYLCGDCPFRRCCNERGIDSCDSCAEKCAMFVEYKNKYVNKCGQI